MKKTQKKIVAVLLCALMILGCGTSSFAEEAPDSIVVTEEAPDSTTATQEAADDAGLTEEAADVTGTKDPAGDTEETDLPDGGKHRMKAFHLKSRQLQKEPLR